MRKNKIPEQIPSTKGLAYVGLWRDGSPGWFLPRFLLKEVSQDVHSKDDFLYAKGEWGYLCEVTIKPVKVNGKYKRRRVK